MATYDGSGWEIVVGSLVETRGYPDVAPPGFYARGIVTELLEPGGGIAFYDEHGIKFSLHGHAVRLLADAA